MSHQDPFPDRRERDARVRMERPSRKTVSERQCGHSERSLVPRLRVVCVVGTRPNLVKIAPIMRALGAHAGLDVRLVHTGQHRDPALSDSFFEDLAIPQPRVHLGVRGGTQSQQMAEIIARFEPLLTSWQPQVVLVVGDVTSTLACALVAAKATLSHPFPTVSGIRTRPLLVHVEAGLRSFDDAMPEEHNRRLTDALSDLLYASEPSGLTNLKREGIADERVVLVGNVMIDSLKSELAQSTTGDVHARLGLEGPYGVVTLHRPANVDDPRVLDALLLVLDGLAKRLPLVFPVHPRTRLRLQESSLSLESPRWRLLEPQRYRDFVRLLSSARMVITDSGGIQEETTVLAVPCLTLRPSTERPITVEQGTNILVGRDPSAITAAFERAIAAPSPGRVPDLWDGRAAERIVAHLLTTLEPALCTSQKEVIV